MTQVKSPPALIDATPLLSEVTSTGVPLLVWELLPSWPLAFAPQHLAPPVVVAAQLKPEPALTEAMPLPSPVTSTGVFVSPPMPLPVAPSARSPQHFTPPPVVTAQVCHSPPLIDE